MSSYTTHNKYSVLRLSDPLREQYEQTSNRPLREAYITLGHLFVETNAPELVQQTAVQILTSAHNEEFFAGRRKETATASALHLSFRIHEQPRALTEIAELVDTTANTLSRYNSAVQDILSLPVPPAPPTEYLERFTTQLNERDNIQLSDHIVTLSEELIEAQGTQLISGRDPTVIAAAAIYSACLIENANATQREIAHIAGTTEVSIRNTYRELLEEYHENKEDFTTTKR